LRLIINQPAARDISFASMVYSYKRKASGAQKNKQKTLHFSCVCPPDHAHELPNRITQTVDPDSH
jgi:hypothetical protein